MNTLNFLGIVLFVCGVLALVFNENVRFEVERFRTLPPLRTWRTCYALGIWMSPGPYRWLTIGFGPWQFRFTTPSALESVRQARNANGGM